MRIRIGMSLGLGIVTLALALMGTGCAHRSAESPRPVPGANDPSMPRGGTSGSGAPMPPAGASAGTVSEAVSFVPAFFTYDSHALDDQARVALDTDAALLRARPELRITIEGHCDERGPAEYNLSLGERRALAARDYLVGAGVPASRIRTITYGKERPFDDGHGESAWANNRRAHCVAD